MSTQTISEYRTVTFTSVRCYKCDLEFFAPSTFWEERHRLGDAFYCPSGHCQLFTKSTKQQLEETERALAASRTKLQLERDQKAAAEASLERLKKRTSKGVCPCCNRTFSQLGRHMECKHPNWPKK